MAWRRGARLDGWTDHLKPDLWWTALDHIQLDVRQLLHEPYELHSCLPWDHVHVKYGRDFLEKEQLRSTTQLNEMRSRT